MEESRPKGRPPDVELEGESLLGGKTRPRRSTFVAGSAARRRVPSPFPVGVPAVPCSHRLSTDLPRWERGSHRQAALVRQDGIGCRACSSAVQNN